MKKRAILVLADGFEEIEAVTPLDVLRRGGIEVTVAGLEKLEVKGSRGLVVKAEKLFEQCLDLPDAIILPGGPGSEILGKSEKLKTYLERMIAENKLIAAICAAPAAVLGHHGMLEGKKATCYPGFENHLGAKASFVDKSVVQDGIFITSRGPGTALEFSLAVLGRLTDERIAAVVAEKMLVHA